MAIIQAFNRERAFLAEFDKANAANRETNTHAQYLNSLFFPGSRRSASIAMVRVLFVGDHLLLHGSIQVGTVTAAVFMLNMIFQPLQELSDLYGQVQSAGAAMEKITGILDTEPEIRDAPGARSLRSAGHLQFDRVTFSYGREPVLHAIEIEVPAGNCLALVGESGGGKSTTAKLVGRFYDPDEGAVRVDGHDLRERRTAGVSAAARRRAAGSVPLRRHDRRQHPLRPAGRDRRAGRGRRARRSESTGSRAASRRGCCTRCARAAPGSRPASAS